MNMIRIAHLSDIHFGNRFSPQIWDLVVIAVTRFDPDLIVVTGDLVDDPSPRHLLVAKCALSDLCEEARAWSREKGDGRSAELIVIPGNHDVYESGVAVGLSRLDWFERVFNSNTSSAEKILKKELNVDKLGFCGHCLNLPNNVRPQDSSLYQKAKTRAHAFLQGRWSSGDEFSSSLEDFNPSPCVKIFEDRLPVLVALLDSNSGRGFYTATGEVDNGQLLQLQSELSRVAGNPYLARIALVHHHVLPIAFAPGATRGSGEPMMVLRNAGAVLRVLADHKFDLILHGHWHTPQFSRIDFGSVDRPTYPMAVVSAGSAAITSRDNVNANSLNLITIGGAGRISVKSLYYGAGQGPDPNGEPGRHYRLFGEPLSETKSRAYIRARERHVIDCQTREQVCEITENGDLWVKFRLGGLRRNSGLTYLKRPLTVYIPRHGHLIQETVELDEASVRNGVVLSPATDYQPRDRLTDVPEGGQREEIFYWIKFPGGGLDYDAPATYAVTYGLANCMMMTRWEALERSRDSGEVRSSGFDHEWIGARIAFPTSKLVLRLKLPPSLSKAQVKVGCYRHPKYPSYKIDSWGDAEFSGGDLIPDPEAQEQEQRKLSFEAATHTWVLEIEQPIVGYVYSLRWQLPTDEPDRAIEGRTIEWRRALLRLAKRIDEGNTRPSDNDAIDQFYLLCDTMKAEFFGAAPDERWIVALYVYDLKRLAIRPVLSSSWRSERLPVSFELPYGDSVAGAAFQQRRVIAWNRQSMATRLWGDYLITPKAYPALASGPNDSEIENVLALPIYLPGTEDAKRPSPWATIGVVSMATSSPGSPITGMTAPELLRRRAIAQVQVDAIIKKLQPVNGDSGQAWPSFS